LIVSNSTERVESVETAFTSLPGAVGDPPEHYGNPLGEQKALAAGEAVVYLGHRGVVTVSGPDRLTWLDSLTSQALTSLKPGESTETLQLDPTGRVEFAIRVVDDGSTSWLLVDAAEAAGLASWLTKMRFMLRVEVVDRSADFVTIGSLGLAVSGATVVWTDPWNAVTRGGHQYASRDDYAWNYSESLFPRVELAETLGALVSTSSTRSVPAAGTLALEALRIAAWRPRLATEVDERTIPHELDWLRSAVHLSKGCYRGQETVAKVHNLGHPPRRLVMLHIDGSDGVLAKHGDVVEAGDAPVGLVTSAALHFELGPIALAVVKRSVDPALTLAIVADDARLAAAQEIIVPTDAGASVDVPRLPRLGAVKR
jgi:tRNA-modifying protein YgfZ